MQHHQIPNLSRIIESYFAVQVFCIEVKVNSIWDDTISKHVTDENALKILMENMRKMDSEQQQTKLQNVISILNVLM